MNATASVSEEDKKPSATAERSCRQFSLPEIQLVTADFDDAHVIGHGGFGKVYKGLIDDGTETVAIKRLAPNSNQGEDEFLMEIKTLSKLRHVNLVSLIGYCNENEEMILVYEYIARGTLADHLHKLRGNNDDCLSLTWKQRLKICIGAARGLDYLHTGSSIIHRDVKSTNILLDENFLAKVSDFGLAKHLSTSNSQSHVSTIVKGSFGYLDPSYFTTGRLTRKRDVYAFGVVLLEVLSGRAAVDLRLVEDEMSLAIWAGEKIRKGKMKQIVATNLRDEISEDCLKAFVGVAKRCLHREPKKRFTMAQAVVQLEFALEQQERKAATNNASRFFPSNAFWSMVKPSGSTEKNPKQVDVNAMLNGIEEDATEDKQTIDMHSVAFIPLHELNDITNNFSSSCLIGEGSRARVYQGVLKNGQAAAIKRLKYTGLSDEEFLAQVLIESSLKHENLVQLLGYCVDNSQRFLAYEFAPNWSLHCLLHGSDQSRPVLSWAQRVKIAIGVARGLEYIHEKAQIHCGIESRNVLLFDDLAVAKIADFGGSTIYPYEALDYYGECYHSGRLDPSRYVLHDEISWRSDVYSFGVVLLELLTGRTVFDHTRPRGQRSLLPLVGTMLKHRLKQLVDSRLEGDYPSKAIAKMAAVVNSCVHYNPRFRPEMKTVVKALSALLDAVQENHEALDQLLAPIRLLLQEVKQLGM